jgi:hypothetical protein
MNRRPSAIAIAVLGLAVVVAGCGASTSPTPSAAAPSPPPPSVAPAAPSPSPSPDVAALFLKDMSDITAERVADVSGMLTVGAVVAPLSGLMQMRGADQRTELRIDLPGAPTEQSTVAVGGSRFVSSNGGPWFEEAAAAGSQDLGSVLADIVTLRDGGTEQRDGVTVHHLLPSTGTSSSFDLPASVVGLADESQKDPTASMDLFATTDGSPAYIDLAASWTQLAGEQEAPAVIDMTLAFRDGASVDIARPPDEEIWKRFVSKRYGYSIGYPSVWEILIPSARDGEPDIFAESDTELGFVIRERQPKAAADHLDAYAAAFIKATSKLSGKPETDERVMVGILPGRRLTYHEKLDGRDVFTVYTLTIKGRNGYQIGTVGPPGYEEDVINLNEVTAATFALDG